MNNLEKAVQSIGGCISALCIFVVAILFMPLLTIWCLNTLVLGPLGGLESCLSYDFFTWHWLAALLSGGVIISPFINKK